jgi:hypothetical protein
LLLNSRGDLRMRTLIAITIGLMFTLAAAVAFLSFFAVPLNITAFHAYLAFLAVVVVGALIACAKVVKNG